MIETIPLQAVRRVLEAILEETVILAMPDPASADRPALPYTSIRTLSDRSLATVRREMLDLLAPEEEPGDDPDLRQTRAQQRRALVQVTLHGGGATSRGVRAEVELDSERARAARAALGVSVGVASGVEDVTGLIGNEWVATAQLVLWVTYVQGHSEDIYSIQTAEVTCVSDA